MTRITAGPGEGALGRRSDSDSDPSTGRNLKGPGPGGSGPPGAGDSEIGPGQSNATRKSSAHDSETGLGKGEEAARNPAGESLDDRDADGPRGCGPAAPGRARKLAATGYALPCGGRHGA